MNLSSEVKKLSLPVFFWGSFLILSACASYQSNVQQARDDLEYGRYQNAIEKLKPLAEKDSDDQLVYLFDLGMAYQLAGDYKESNRILLKADKLSEVQDYHSISRIAGSLLSAAELVQYKGESYEKILVNAMMAVNYLSLGELDDAMVEVRRLNEKLTKYRIDGGKSYEQLSIAKYLSAIIYEAQKKYDDAYIAYDETYKIDGSQKILTEDLIRAAKMARRNEEYRKWKDDFSDIKEKPSWYDKNLGEFVLIFQSGWIQRKYPDPHSPRFPYLRHVFTSIDNVLVEDESSNQYTNYFRYSVEDTAQRIFNEDYGALVANRLAGIATKAVAADQIRQKNEALGNIAWIVMNIADRADLRQWSTLPGVIQVVRIPMSAGHHHFVLKARGWEGNVTGETLQEFDVDIKPGEKIFRTVRTLK